VSAAVSNCIAAMCLQVSHYVSASVTLYTYSICETVSQYMPDTLFTLESIHIRRDKDA